MQWKEISPDVAREHKLYGFGGWLLVIWIAYLLGQISSLANVFNMDMLLALYGSKFIAIAVIILGFILALPFLILAPMKHPAMPRLTKLSVWTSFALSSIISVFVVSFSMFLMAAGMALGWAVLLTLYLNRSRRVNLTYLHRIPADV